MVENDFLKQYMGVLSVCLFMDHICACCIQKLEEKSPGVTDTDPHWRTEN